MAAAPINAIIFVGNELTKQKLQTAYPGMTTVNQSLIAGALAGFASLSVLVPMELLKCRAQMMKTGNLNVQNEIKSILNESGTRGLYRGFAACAARDIPGWACYFASYEYLKSCTFYNKYSCSEKAQRWRQTAWTLNAGGCAGVLSWLITMPQDYIKTM